MANVCALAFICLGLWSSSRPYAMCVSNCSGIMTSRAADESAGVTLRPCCSALTPPGLNVSYDWCSEGVNFSLAICAACFAQVVAVRDVVLFLGWNNLFLFYDGSLCHHERSALLAAMSGHHIGSIPVSVSSLTADSIDMILDTVRSSHVKTALVCITSDALASIFYRMEERSGISYADLQWLVVCSGLETSHLQSIDNIILPVVLLCADTNATVARELGPDGAVTRVNASVVADWRLPEHQAISKNVETDFALLSYNRVKGVLEVKGHWTPRRGLQVNSDVIKYSSYVCKTHMRVGVEQAEPFLMKLSSNDSVRYEGMCIDMINELALRLNFNYTLVEPPDGQYGAPEDNGTWNGMVGMLMRGELDIAIGPFTITSMREEVIDFTVPFMPDGGGILTKGGDPGPDPLTVFYPLPVAMWLSLGGAVIVTGAVLYVIALSVRRRSLDRDTPEDSPWTFWESVFIAYGSLVEQGAIRHPVSSAGRLVLGCWWLFTILIVSIYTASLAALLTVRVQGQNVDSIQDLAASSLTPLTLQGTSWYTAIRNDSSEVFQQIAERMETIPEEKGVEKLVKKGGIAYIMDVSAVDYMYRKDCQQLHMAQRVFSVNGLGLALPQGDLCKDAVNNIILKLQESGVLEIWKQRWWRTSTDCATPRQPGSTSVSDQRQQLEVVSIGGILILYSAVLLLATLCFLLQQLWLFGTLRRLRARMADSWAASACHCR